MLTLDNIELKMESSSFHDSAFTRDETYLKSDPLNHNIIPVSNHKSKVHNENSTLERDICYTMK